MMVIPSRADGEGPHSCNVGHASEGQALRAERAFNILGNGKTA